jgi:hypothetical protein
MNVDELFKICPPVRTLNYPKTLSRDIEQLKLKQSNKTHELPVFVDSADLIYLLTRQVKTYKVYEPFELLTNIHYRKQNGQYFHRESRDIHYGWYNRENFFVVKSAPVIDANLLDQTYKQAIKQARIDYQTQLELQVATYDDILLINRRLLPFNMRAMTRVTDRKVVVFKWNWLKGELM